MYSIGFAVEGRECIPLLSSKNQGVLRKKGKCFSCFSHEQPFSFLHERAMMRSLA